MVQGVLESLPTAARHSAALRSCFLFVGSEEEEEV